MKFSKILLIINLVAHYSLLQGQDTSHYSSTKIRKVSFVTNINIENVTKDGIYLNNYVVNIPYQDLKKLNGKKVRISGKVTIVKGLKHNTNPATSQGRQEDIKHILKPKIKIIDE